MHGTVEMLDFLFGTEKYPTILVTNFCSKTMLIYFVLYCVFESNAFGEFGKHLALQSSTASCLFLIIRSVIAGLVGIIWMYKTEEGCKAPSSGLTKHITSYIFRLQSAVILLITFALSIQAVYDVFVLNPQRIRLSSHAILSLAGLKQVTPLTFFVMRDTPIRAMVYAWGMGLVVNLACCLYAHDSEQMVVLFLYAVGSFIIFADILKQNKTMSEMIAKLQNTLKENEKLAVEAQAVELRAMIGNVAHDLKTPLTSFLSGIECMHDVIAERATQLHDAVTVWTKEQIVKCRAADQELLTCLQNMTSTNSFMLMTINRCLDYTKTTNGFKLVPTFETVLLKYALEMPLKLIQGAQHAISIQVNAISEAICSHIITDKQWLVENLLCLLSNAAKYSSKGTVTVDVFSVKLNADDIPKSPRTRRAVTSSAPSGPTEYLRFEVQDTGVGLSDEAMQGLFNPFKQAQRLAGGTGLGLFSLAKRIEALQGTYGVMRRPDGEQGSVFWFAIPYRPDTASAQVLLSHHRGLLSHSTSSEINTSEDYLQEPVFNLPHLVEGPFNVLVVDDAPLIVKMTTMLLTRKGHTVQHAVNGAEALEKLRAHVGSAVVSPFDVVLMDLQMPVLDGIEAIRRLRAAEDKQQQQQQQQQSRGSSLNNSGRGRGSDSSANGSARQFVIALSANSDEETRQEALTAGADAFMSKPFTYDGFAEIMSDQLRMQKNT